MTRALVTGIGGFVGSHLADFLLARGYDVFGTILRGESLRNIEQVSDRIEVFECDLRDSLGLEQVLERTCPEEIYHLAAVSHVPTSFSRPRLTFQVNIIGTLNLLEAVREQRLRPRILCAGSASEYGVVPSDTLPITEEVRLCPVDPYGVSKAGANLLAYQYFRAHGMHILRTRSFNLIGPRQSPDFAVSSFARQIAVAENCDSSRLLRVGDLAPERDLTDVRDAVAAYWMLVQEGEPGEVYNVCSGQGFTMADVLDRLVGQSRVDVTVVSDTAKMRTTEIPTLVGDNTKLRHQTGWMPKFVLDETLSSILEYWREEIRRSSLTQDKGNLRA